jgi:hypothetical protein
VKAALYGKKGLQIRDRFLQKVKASLFGLTAEGRARVCELLGQAVTKERAPESTIALTPEEETLLECLTSKRLKRKIHEGTIDDWTFDDACRIWGLDGSHVGNTIDRFLGYTKQTIQSLQNKTTGSYEPIRFGSTSIPVASLQTYAKLLDSLETKFAVHLTLMRRRKKKVIA